MRLRIYDTGYFTTDLVNQQAVADRAGFDGTSTCNYIELHLSGITRNAGANVDDGVNVGNYASTDLNFTSFANATYDLDCFVKKVDDSVLTYQYGILTQLVRLEKTKSLKVLYPSVATDTIKTSVELLGGYNAVNGVFQGSGKPLSASTPYISGRVLKVSGLKDVGKSKIFNFKITFECVEEVQD